MVDRAMQAWEQSEPKGHIGTMLRSMFDTRDPQIFWTQSVYRSKSQDTC